MSDGLKSTRLFTNSRNSAGTRTLADMLKHEGVVMGRFKVGRLMKEQGLTSKQSGPHAYRVANVERSDIPNKLNREFDVEAPNRVWCGDMTYIWTGSGWHYAAVVIDLFTSWLLAGRCRLALMQSLLRVRWILLMKCAVTRECDVP